jgi:hypothetical protein
MALTITAFGQCAPFKSIIIKASTPTALCKKIYHYRDRMQTAQQTLRLNLARSSG